jgi:flagellar biosynthesis/type III secretory pathway protein FliH
MTPVARIIRAERRGPAVVPAELYEAQLSASEVRQEARRQAAQLLAAASADIERARTAGYARGYEEGSARAARELLEIAAVRASALEAQADEIRELALLFAGKLTARAFEHEPAAIEAVLRPLLASVRRARRVAIRVHPEAVAFVESRLSTLAAYEALEGALEVAGDPAITHGGCVIESDLGELDARIETRLSELCRALGWERP